MADRASPSAVRTLESLTFCLSSWKNIQNSEATASAKMLLNVATEVSCSSGSRVNMKLSQSSYNSSAVMSRNSVKSTVILNP
jgi:hypothetical protein